MAVAYRFVDAEELWLFVSELRGPVALALAAAVRRASARRSAARSERRATARRHGFELGGISLNVAVVS